MFKCPSFKQEVSLSGGERGGRSSKEEVNVNFRGEQKNRGGRTGKGGGPTL